MELEKELLKLGFQNQTSFYWIKGKMEVGLVGSDFVYNIMTARYDKTKTQKIKTMRDLQEFNKECTGKYLYAEIKIKTSKEEINKITERGYLMDD